MGQRELGGNSPDGEFRHPDPVVNESLDWFFLLETQGNDLDVQRQFAHWLNSHPRHRDEFRKLEIAWNSPEVLAAARRASEQYRVLGTSVPARRQGGRWRGGWSRGAAAIAGTVMLLTLVSNLPHMLLRWQADHLTLVGEQSRIVLPDGSSAVLNTDSALALEFSHDVRKVTLLRGEAFFDVISDPNRPFRVSGEYGEVEVTGTAFSVRNGETEDVVTLERGHVHVIRLANRGDSAELDPGQMVVVTNASLSDVRTVDSGSMLAWLQGRIAFNDRPFAQAVGELQRYFEGKVIVLDSAASRTVVSGNYRIDDPVGAMRSLTAVVGARMIELPGGVIVIR